MRFGCHSFVSFRDLQSLSGKMNFTFCLKFLFATTVVCCLTLSNVKAEISSETFGILLNYTVNSCKARENATEEDVTAILSLEGDWPDSRESKCFLDCFLEEIGLVRNPRICIRTLQFNSLFHSSRTTSFTNEDFSPSPSCYSKKLTITRAKR